MHNSVCKMIFSLQKYEEMRAVVSAAISSNNSVTIADAMALGVDYDSLISCYSQLFVRNLKLSIRRLNTTVISSIIARVDKGESLLSIASEYSIGTFKMAKIYIENAIDKSLTMSAIVSNPSVIVNERVRADVLKMIEIDPLSSPEVDLVKECLGKEYEELLINLLTERKMCFETEAILRSKGKPKTPDILFLIPMAIKKTTNPYCNSSEDYGANGNNSGSNGLVGNYSTNRNTSLSGNSDTTSNENNDLLNSSNLNDSFSSANNSQIEENDYQLADTVINWIDSKALFADAITFKENLEQFRAYNNRYGRGLVIYWHGFSSDVFDLLSDDMIVVRDTFPDLWVFPTGEVADGRTPSFDKIDL